MLLITLHIYLITLIFINCFIKFSIVPYFFHHVILLIILYIKIQTLKSINCNILLYYYFLRVTMYPVHTATDIEMH